MTSDFEPTANPNAAPHKHYAHVRRELTNIKELWGWRKWFVKGWRRVGWSWGLVLGLGARISLWARVGVLKAKLGLCVEFNRILPNPLPSYRIFCPTSDFLERVRCSDGQKTWISIRICFKGCCFGSTLATNSSFKKSLHFRVRGGFPFIIHLDIPDLIQLTPLLSGHPRWETLIRKVASGQLKICDASILIRWFNGITSPCNLAREFIPLCSCLKALFRFACKD